MMLRWARKGLPVAAVIWALTLAPYADEAEVVDAKYDYRLWSYDVEGNEAEVEERARLTIRNERGEHNHGYLWFSESEHRELKDLRVTIYDATGTQIREYGKDEFEKTCGFGENFQVYADICYFYLDVIPPAFPYTIQYSSKHKYKSLFFVRGRDMVGSLPVDSAELSIRLPRELPLEFRVYGIDVTPDTTTDGDRQVIRWTARVIEPPKDDEEGNQSGGDGEDEDVDPRYGEIAWLLGEFELGDANFRGRQWADVARWYATLSADCYGYDDDRKPPPPCSVDCLDIAKSVYDDVRHQIRYVSVSIGISGWKPHSVSRIDRLGYGDCKDMATLLISRLRERGIEAHPALVLTRGEGEVDPDFPNFEFNHVIAAATIDEDTVWMDPTCNSCPFGDLPYSDEAIDVLLVSGEGGTLVRTPESPRDENRIVRHSNATIRADRTLELQSSLEVHGNSAQYVRNSFPHKSRKERGATIQNWFDNLRVPMNVEQYALYGVDDPDSTVRLSVNAVSKKKLRSIGGKVYFAPEMATFRYSTGYNYGYPNTIIDTIKVTWAEELSIHAIDLPESIDTSLASSDIRLKAWHEADTATIVCERRFGLYKSERTNLEEYDRLKKVAEDVAGRYLKLHVSK